MKILSSIQCKDIMFLAFQIYFLIQHKIFQSLIVVHKVIWLQIVLNTSRLHSLFIPIFLKEIQNRRTR